MRNYYSKYTFIKCIYTVSNFSYFLIAIIIHRSEGSISPFYPVNGIPGQQRKVFVSYTKIQERAWSWDRSEFLKNTQFTWTVALRKVNPLLVNPLTAVGLSEVFSSTNGNVFFSKQPNNRSVLSLWRCVFRGGMFSWFVAETRSGLRCGRNA